MAEGVYQTLLEAICRGRIPRGAVLSAVSLSTQLQVSRTPVVEAIRRLTADGLLSAETGRKARVVKFTSEEIVDIYEMRRLLEGSAAERAATRISSESLKELLGVAKSLAEQPSVDWTERAHDFDRKLHEAIAKSSGSPRLVQDIARYRLLVRGLCQMSGSEQNLKAALREHQQILRALRRRDPARARVAMVKHIEQRLAAVLSELKQP